MAYDVTSWFIEQAESQKPAPIVRQFLLGTSDYSDRVIRWPKFKQGWDDIKPVMLNIDLANEDGELNTLRDDKLIVRTTAQINFGFTHPDSGDELVTQYVGLTSRAKFQRGSVNITLTDKFEQLGKRVIGSSDDPVSYAGSDYLPADIAWYIVTSHGGLSSVESTSNPDIDYAAFETWRARFNDNSVYMHANFEGVKCLEALRKIGRHTLSAIFTKEGKISFHKFNQADENSTDLTSDNINDLIVEFSDRDMVNKQYAYADYSVESDYWQTTVYDNDATSINSYGLSESIEKDKNVWYVGSGGALDYCQSVISIRSEPYDRLRVKTFMHGFVRLVGETISVVDPFHGINEGYRIMGREINLNTGESEFFLDRSQFLSPFILDTSTLGSDAVLT